MEFNKHCLTVTQTFIILLLTGVNSADVGASTECKTLIISGDYIAPRIASQHLYSTLVFNYTTQQGTNTAESHLLQREVSANDIRENYFTVFHFIPQCSFVILDGPMSRTESMIAPLVKARVLRPVYDFFVIGITPVNHFLLSTYVPHKLARDHKTNRWEFGRLTSEKEMAAGRSINVLAIAGAQFYRFPTSSTNAGGIYHYMAVECSYRLNITMNIKATPGSGAKNKDGKWSGAVGALLSGEADLAFPIGFTIGCQGAIDGSNTLAFLAKVFWVKASTATTNAADAILKPLDLTVWLTLLLVIASASPILYQFVRTDYEDGVKRSTLCAASADIVIRLLLEQSTALRRCTGGRTRLMIFMWAILGTIIITGYRSKLYYFLTFTEADHIPRTFLELAYSDYQLYFRTYGGVGLTDLLKSTDPVHHRLTINNRLQLVKSTDECIKKVVVTEGNTACLDYDFSGDYAIAANSSLYLEAEQRLSEQLMKRSFDSMGQYMITWAFPKGSPLTRPFNQVIIWMQASGLYEYWVRLDQSVQKVLGMRYLKSQKDSVVRRSLEELEEELTSGPQPLPIDTFMLPLMLICVGSLLALVVFFVEKAEAELLSSII